MLKNALWSVIDFVIPPRCVLCHEIVLRPGHICGACWGKLNFITEPYCSQCSFPLELEIERDSLCGACLKSPPLFQKARAALVYDEVSKPLILKFKHGDGTYLAPALVDWMHRAGQELLVSADYLIPVPLHWRRLISRRYNQAALLAQGLGKRTQVPVLLHAIKRVRNTPSQGHLSKQDRAQNVKKAFSVSPKYVERLKGKRVVIIDDVFTSGATLQACAKVLLKHEVAAVNVLILARVATAGMQL